MLMGHYAAALVVKVFAPNTHLAVLAILALLPDLLMYTLVVCGIESWTYNPSYATAGSVFPFTLGTPYTHPGPSIVMACGLALTGVLGGWFFYRGNPWWTRESVMVKPGSEAAVNALVKSMASPTTSMVAMAVVAVLHLALDGVAFRGAQSVGLPIPPLHSNRLLLFFVELALFLPAFLWYENSTVPRDAVMARLRSSRKRGHTMHYFVAGVLFTQCLFCYTPISAATKAKRLAFLLLVANSLTIFAAAVADSQRVPTRALPYLSVVVAKPYLVGDADQPLSSSSSSSAIKQD